MVFKSFFMVFTTKNRLIAKFRYHFHNQRVKDVIIRSLKKIQGLGFSKVHPEILLVHK